MGETRKSGFLLMSGVNLSRRAATALVGAAFAACLVPCLTTSAWSQSLFGLFLEGDRVSIGQRASYGEPLPQSGQPAPDGELAPALQRQIVLYPSKEPAGTIIIDTPHTFLYLTLGGGKAIRYGIGVGRKGFTWSGIERVSRKSEWPDWIPPAEMIARQPYLPRWVGGGPGNPLGARALYLGNTDYRIHGTNDPASIGTQVSSGCIRMRNDDVVDLYRRVSIGTKVVVLRGDPHTIASDSPAGPRLGVTAEHGGGVMSARIATGPRGVAVDAVGAWNETLQPRALY
jgi:lipoprotein-anchoring transpeptidase ErfK/SrfK